ncbi:fumarylacetoacetate hydrolase family protein [Actinomadura graeca]|uniref:Fumarylacetoacetate hydrolase family protein n=1 Tax=Actinomadura graeca TaxID=2750812 RepID=A0ABX8QQ47_9ACTN|nr:fumarylacetoacetate hydrolase family protein [Actinomadura graeca]QXJ20745.1 fumarylacetoacetate hydrolase family protein [Actinomadura graeca]
MRLLTYRTGDGTRAGRLDGADVTPLDAPDVGALLAADAGWRDRAAATTGRTVPLTGLDLAPAVPRPSKIICVGLNYKRHIAETGHDTPEHPTLFAKFARALIGASDPVVLPAASTAMDWEAELAVVIGRTVTRARGAGARAAIAGYTVANDVSARDFQGRTTQWLQGKTFDSTTPLGPALVTGDEVGDAADLEITCTVGGEVMQRGRTSDMLFPPEEIVSYISGIVTLDPGDVILTGTPSGIGDSRVPPVRLRPGDLVETEIEGLGVLRNRCAG